MRLKPFVAALDTASSTADVQYTYHDFDYDYYFSLEKIQTYVKKL